MHLEQRLGAPSLPHQASQMGIAFMRFALLGVSLVGLLVMNSLICHLLVIY